MLFQIEFIRSSRDGDAEVVRRNAGQFASEKDAETYGVINRPTDADGFRVFRQGVLVRTVSLRLETRDD